MNIRAIAAIALCKLLRYISRILHRGGTAMPGRWALKVCPDLLKRLSQNVRTIAVTGTNGKTTSSRMIEEAFSEAGLSYFSNRSGANLISGITTEFVMNCTLLGKMKKEYAVIECDEAAARKTFGDLRPQVIVVTNLFRDQLDRYGEITHTLENIREGIRNVPDAVLCLNADCSLTASLADELPNRCVFFGINAGATISNSKPVISDAPHCIRCKTEYEYDYISYGHLGAFRCPKCGYKRRSADYAVAKVLSLRADSSSLLMNIKGREYNVEVNLPAMYNIYNAAGTVAAVTEMGLGTEIAVSALAGFECGFGRMERFALGSKGCRMMLVKNPAGCTQVMEFLEKLDDEFELVICLNDRGADGTDISWIWDAEFEKLENMKDRIGKVIVSGDRASDMRIRIKYAGIDDSRIVLERSYEKLVTDLEGADKPVFIMPTYTAMLELRSVVVKHCGGKEFWE